MSRRLLLLMVAAAGVVVAQDPPARVGRLSYVSGSVSFQPGGVNDWVSAAVNRPLTVGDQLYADTGARAEIHVPGAAFRLGSQTAFEFMNLDDRNTQVRLSEGTLDVRVRRLDENFEVDTPNLAFTIRRPGEYRIDTNPDAYLTYVTVRDGEGQVTGNSAAFSVHVGEQAVVTGQDGAQYNVYQAPGYDDFDNWALSRDRREDRVRSAHYVSPYVVGYEDLDQYGYWRSVPEYGECWVPRDVPAGWAPYHYGHWAWIDPWGWTWVDDEPWGFAPFHYGRWAYLGGFWGWVPGPVAVAPVYAPALVAWVGLGGGGFGASFGFGGGPMVGWLPLGPRDVYIPAYGASQTYISRVNVTNTTVINNTNITNIYNNYVQTKTISTTNYMNRSVPGAVVAVPQNALAGARPVQQVAVRVQPSQINAVRTVEPAPRVAPQTVSVLGRPASVFGGVPRPPAAVLSRPIVAKSAPPPAPAPFQQRQPLLAQNPGHPLPIQQQQQMARLAPASARPAVRVIAQVRPVTPPVSNAPAPRPAPGAPAVSLHPSAPPPAVQNMPRPVQPEQRPQAQPRPYQQPSKQQPPQQPLQPERGAPAQVQRPHMQSPPRPYEPPSVQQRRQGEPAQSQPPLYSPPSAQQRPPAQPSRPVVPPQMKPHPVSPPNRPYEPPPAVQERRTPIAQPNRPSVPSPQQRPYSAPPPQSRRVEPQPTDQSRNRSAQPQPKPQYQPPPQREQARPAPPPRPEARPTPPPPRQESKVPPRQNEEKKKEER